MDNKILFIYPSFTVTWKKSLDALNKDIDYLEYREDPLYKMGIYYKLIQSITYIVDILLPRHIALSSKLRKLRINKIEAEKFWKKILSDKNCDKYNYIYIIKPTGLLDKYINNKHKNKVKVLLWDSVARYPVDKTVKKYILATTSPFDSESLNVKLFTFNEVVLKENFIFEKNQCYYFIGRFSLYRFFKAIIYAYNLKNSEFYFGKAPFNMITKRIQLNKNYINLSNEYLKGRLETILMDLNEDSPSLRLDNIKDETVLADIKCLPSTLEKKKIKLISYNGIDKKIIKYKKSVTLLELLKNV